jgi:uncharacterized protein
MYRLNLRQWFRQPETQTGILNLMDLPRLADWVNTEQLTPRPEHCFSWFLNGHTENEAGGLEQRFFLTLEITGRIPQTCQRCLDEMTLDIHSKNRFEVFTTEEKADEAIYSEDDSEPLVMSEEFDLIELIEDDILLAIPLAPKHKRCPNVHQSLLSGADGETVLSEEVRNKLDKPSPFAALATLKKST